MSCCDNTLKMANPFLSNTGVTTCVMQSNLKVKATEPICRKTLASILVKYQIPTQSDQLEKSKFTEPGHLLKIFTKSVTPNMDLKQILFPTFFFLYHQLEYVNFKLSFCFSCSLALERLASTFRSFGASSKRFHIYLLRFCCSAHITSPPSVLSINFPWLVSGTHLFLTFSCEIL